MGQLLKLNINITPNDILIIGGGSSIKNFKLGTIIDNFPIVARINNYETSGYEELVGSKTNIWFNGANQGLKKRSKIPENVITLIPPQILIDKGKNIHNRIKKRLHTEKYNLVELEAMQQFEKAIGIKRITTGTNSILWALNNFEKVIIHGFDFFVDSKTHYHDGPIKKWLINNGWIKKASKHNTIKEKAFIDSLISEKKIYKLVDIIK
jgi:hypothetical protein